MRHSFRDPVSGILKAHGFMDGNEPGDVMQEEPEDFALKPGEWKWQGGAWVPVLVVE